MERKVSEDKRCEEWNPTKIWRKSTHLSTLVGICEHSCEVVWYVMHSVH